MFFIEINLKKFKMMTTYFVLHISNKNIKNITNDVNLFSKNNFLFFIINLNCIIFIYKLYILIF